MKRLLLFIFTAIVSAGLFAQLSTEESQILYMDFNDDTELTLNDQDIDVVDDVDLEGEAGKFGGAVSFNGTSSYLVMDLIPDFDHGMDWSISFWVKSAVVNQFVWGIMSFSAFSGDPETDYFDDEARVGGLKLGVPDEETVGKLIIDVSWVSDMGPWEEEVPAWDDGEWHHFVITYSSEKMIMNMYMDNAVYAEATEMDIAGDLEIVKEEEGFNDATLEDDNLKLGFAGNGWGPEEAVDPVEAIYFSGSMDEVRLFNVELTAEEVGEIYAFVPTGIRNHAASGQLYVYPNPAGEFIQLNTESEHVSIYNSVGSLVKSIENYTGERISVGNLGEGIYMIRTDDSTTKVFVH